MIRRNKKKFSFRGFKGEVPGGEELRRELELVYKHVDEDVAAIVKTANSDLATNAAAAAAAQSSADLLAEVIDTLSTAFGDYQTVVDVRFSELEARVDAIELFLVPVGMIAMWSGLLAAIPTGWALCDGGGGRPDLRSKFVKGAAAGLDPGVTGGNVLHKHAVGTIVAANESTHTHGAGTYVAAGQIFTGDLVTASAVAATPDLVSPDGSASGVAPQVTATGTNADSTVSGNSGAGSAHTHTLSGDTADTDGQPPFYSVAFIIKTS